MNTEQRRGFLGNLVMLALLVLLQTPLVVFAVLQILQPEWSGFASHLALEGIVYSILIHFIVTRFGHEAVARFTRGLIRLYIYLLMVALGWDASVIIAFNAPSLKTLWIVVLILVALYFVGAVAVLIARLVRFSVSVLGLRLAPYAGFALALFLVWLIVYSNPNEGVSTRGEARSNLYNIQLAIERYAENHGHFPECLIGGRVYAGVGRVNSGVEQGDPLVLEGYMSRFPKLQVYEKRKDEQLLPLHPMGPDFLHRYFLQYDSFHSSVTDFMRLQDEYGDVYGVDNAYSRFLGLEYGHAMGNLAADHRYEDGKWGFPYWLRKRGSIDLISITSQWNFYYKSLKSPGAEKPDGYILMLFGAYYEKGMDAFTTVPGGHELDGRLPDGTGVGMGVPVIPELGLKGDSKPDGVILVLHGGWPWEEGGG